MKMPLRRSAMTVALGGVMALGAVVPASSQDMPFESKIRLKDAQETAQLVCLADTSKKIAVD